MDPGDEILYLQDNLYYSDLSADKSYLINFNPKNVIAERINLDELKLDKKIPFEKEGPNKIPIYFTGFSINKEEQLLVWSYQFYSIFDQEAKKVKVLGLEEIAVDYLSDFEIHPKTFFEIPEQPDRILGVCMQWNDNTYFILDFDLKSLVYKKIDLPELNKFDEYHTEIIDGGQNTGGYGVSVSAIATPWKIILTNNSFNEVLVYDLKKDSTYVKSWDTTLLGYRKKYTPQKRVEHGSEEMNEVFKKLNKEISYGKLIWDESKKRFYRFSSSQKFGEEGTDYDKYIATGADVYLSIFDENLNILAESLVPQLNAPPKKHFVKGGKIWIFENIEDEMAFVRIGIE
ncbi:DUF4221 family protein [Cyclobacterium qasimii]|uniref:Uncharacterized protein n=1 Tax=Cyclobacterium qasimii M12-11B TaxID=641524 RepID=S7V6F8_9BACT|nr:DUF4221 family protein [Cyclobacterium qasimii]EPR65526.1 hypothetical protein ADICYQ_5447 [Cyclobacterium qasimii M12-11B]